MAHATLQRLLPQFVRAGLVEDRAVFVHTLEGVARLRNRTLPWVVIAAVSLAWTILAPDTHQGHDVLWAGDAARPGGGATRGAVGMALVLSRVQHRQRRPLA